MPAYAKINKHRHKAGDTGENPVVGSNFMKKLLVSLSVVFLSLAIAYPAMIAYRWDASDNKVMVGGLPPKYLRLYYGPSLKNYTNHIDVLLSNVNTNVYHGWDQYICAMVNTKNYVEAKITGLVLSQQIYSAYSIINSNGLESPYINESTCGFTVTNNSNGVLPPTNFRVVTK